MTRGWKRRGRVAALVVFGAASAGCLPTLEADLSRIETARLLAIRAEPAEVGEGESVRLSAIVVGPDAAPSRAVSYSFCLARKPLSELGPVDPTCLRGGGAGTLDPLGEGETVSAVIDRSACSSFGPRRPPPEPGQAAGRPVDPDPTGGFYQPVIATLPEQSGVLGAVRLDCGLPGADRLQVVEYNQRHRPNENPELERLRLSASDGAEDDWSDLPSAAAPGAQRSTVRVGARITLRAEWLTCEPNTTCAGAETYVRFEPETRTLVDESEELIVSWYATAGRFDEYRTGAEPLGTWTDNRWEAPPDAQVVELWAVLRDGRGGVAARAFELSVE